MPANLPAELAELLIGFLFLVFGAIGIVAGLIAHPRRTPVVLWFGVFCVMYGARLSARSEVLQLATGWPPILLGYTDVLVTYLILVPAGLFIEHLTGSGPRTIVRRTWQLTAIYGVLASLYDLATFPATSMWLNAPVVLTNISIYGWWTDAYARAMRPWRLNAWIVAAAGTLFMVVSVYETVNKGPALGLPFSLEPVAMLLLTFALGWFVLSRLAMQESEYSALSRELALAREIQQSLLPREMPTAPGVRLTAAILPMGAVGGDFYDVTVTSEGDLVVIVADVSGHGMPAALVAAMVKVAFAAEAERERDPGAILDGINRALTGKFERAYVTACCVAVAPGADRIAYASAGHPPALLRRQSGAIEQIGHGSAALTLLHGITYSSIELALNAGDRVILFTDGLLEAARAGTEDDFFGDTELARVVASIGPGAHPTSVVLDAHRRWIGPGTAPSDDVTIVAVERTS